MTSDTSVGESGATESTKTGPKRWQVSLAIIGPVVLLALVLLGMKGCVNHTRSKTIAHAPGMVFPEPARKDGDIPVFENDFSIGFSGEAAFVEIIPDEIYQVQKDKFRARHFPGLPVLGGKLLDVSDGTVLIKAGAASSSGKTYWIRAGGGPSESKYDENFDRLLYSVVGRPVDWMCGLWVEQTGARGRGSLPNYDKNDMFLSYSVGGFKPFMFAGR